MSSRYFLSAEDEELDEFACRAFNPDNHIHVRLPSGAVAWVAADVSCDTLAALDRMAVAMVNTHAAPMNKEVLP